MLITLQSLVIKITCFLPIIPCFEGAHSYICWKLPKNEWRLTDLMGSVLLRTFCSRLIFSLFSVSFPLEARGLLLCPERQSKQNALFPKRSERSHNHRQDFHQIDFLSTFSAHLFRELQSVLIGDYSVSVLFFKGSVLPSFCLKDSSYKTSPLVSAFTKPSQSSATLRCH